MSSPVSVSKKDYEELLSLQANLSGQEPAKKTGAELADDALKAGKQTITTFLLVGLVLFSISVPALIIFSGWAKSQTIDAFNQKRDAIMNPWRDGGAHIHDYDGTKR